MQIYFNDSNLKFLTKDEEVLEPTGALINLNWQPTYHNQ